MNNKKKKKKTWRHLSSVKRKEKNVFEQQSYKTVNKPNKMTNKMKRAHTIHLWLEFSSLWVGRSMNALKSMWCDGIQMCPVITVYCVCIIYCIALRCISNAFIKCTLCVYHFNEIAHQPNTLKMLQLDTGLDFIVISHNKNMHQLQICWQWRRKKGKKKERMEKEERKHNGAHCCTYSTHQTPSKTRYFASFVWFSAKIYFTVFGIVDFIVLARSFQCWILSSITWSCMCIFAIKKKYFFRFMHFFPEKEFRSCAVYSSLYIKWPISQLTITIVQFHRTSTKTWIASAVSKNVEMNCFSCVIIIWMGKFRCEKNFVFS